MKKLTLEDFQVRLNLIHPQEKLQAISYISGRKKAKVKCLTCNTIYEKRRESFLDKRKVSICKKCFPTQPNQLKDDYIPPQGYQLEEKYLGMQHKIKVRHLECGFIWKITPSNLKLGKGCPKCNKKISKGEQKIINWLDKNSIEYLSQYPLKIDKHTLFVDFYLPKLDLYIEYNGEQHYNPVAFFGGEEKFNQQVKNDNLKKDYLKHKLIEISYKDFDNIEVILKSSTTIPKGSRT